MKSKFEKSFWSFLIILGFLIFILSSCQETDLEQILVPATDLQIIFYQDSVRTVPLNKNWCNWFSSNYLTAEVSDELPQKFDGQMIFSRKGKILKRVDFNLSPPIYQYQVGEKVFTKKINQEGIRFLELTHKYPDSKILGN